MRLFSSGSRKKLQKFWKLVFIAALLVAFELNPWGVPICPDNFPRTVEAVTAAGDKSDLNGDGVVDLEDLGGGISITDMTLNDFRMDLTEYLKEHTDLLDHMPPGAFAVTHIDDLIKEEGLEPGRMVGAAARQLVGFTQIVSGVDLAVLEARDRHPHIARDGKHPGGLGQRVESHQDHGI